MSAENSNHTRVKQSGHDYPCFSRLPDSLQWLAVAGDFQKVERAKGFGLAWSQLSIFDASQFKRSHPVKRILFFAQIALLLMLSPCQAGFLDELVNEVITRNNQSGSLDNNTVVKGLKEALATGTERAVKEVARPDGYFGNELIKIMLPAKLQQAASIAGQLGYQQQVDELIVSMNRAAEKAAPIAAGFFGDAIRQMTVEDAKGILNGGDKAATSFFEKKTRGQLVEAFKPKVSSIMSEVGTARAYQDLIGKYQTAPLASMLGVPSLDIDDYVTGKALDGLFIMVGEEEKKIRTNPAAQTTDLLRNVFGSKQ